MTTYTITDVIQRVSEGAARNWPGHLHFVTYETCRIEGRAYSRQNSAWDTPPDVSLRRWYLDEGEPSVHHPESVCPCGVSAVVPLSFGSGETRCACAGCGMEHDL